MGKGVNVLELGENGFFEGSLVWGVVFGMVFSSPGVLLALPG